MEDAHLATWIMLPGYVPGMIFGVFDGHGGRHASVSARVKFRDCFAEAEGYRERNYEKALKGAFVGLDVFIKK